MRREFFGGALKQHSHHKCKYMLNKNPIKMGEGTRWRDKATYTLIVIRQFGWIDFYSSINFIYIFKFKYTDIYYYTLYIFGSLVDDYHHYYYQTFIHSSFCICRRFGCCCFLILIWFHRHIALLRDQKYSTVRCHCLRALLVNIHNRNNCLLKCFFFHSYTRRMNEWMVVW